MAIHGQTPTHGVSIDLSEFVPLVQRQLERQHDVMATA